MKLLWLVILLMFNFCFAQTYPGPRATALGRAAASQQGIWSIQNNPAGMAQVKNAAVEIAYISHFLDRGLSTQAVILGLPFSKNVFGFSFEKYGIKQYSERTLGASYSRMFGDALLLGAGFNYHVLDANHYGITTVFTVRTGVQVIFNELLIFSAYVSNLGALNAEDERWRSAVVNLGAGWTFGEDITFFGDIGKTFGGKLDIKTGLEYVVSESFSLRGGLSFRPFTQYGGLGMRFRDVRLQVAVSSHLELGLSPHISIGYEF